MPFPLSPQPTILLGALGSLLYRSGDGAGVLLVASQPPVPTWEGLGAVGVGAIVRGSLPLAVFPAHGGLSARAHATLHPKGPQELPPTSSHLPPEVLRLGISAAHQPAADRRKGIGITRGAEGWVARAWSSEAHSFRSLDCSCTRPAPSSPGSHRAGTTSTIFHKLLSLLYFWRRK